MRRDVARWESQNRAIRAAFGAPPRSALTSAPPRTKTPYAALARRRARRRPARPFGQARKSGARRRLLSPPRARSGRGGKPVASPAPSRWRRRSSGSGCLRSRRGRRPRRSPAGASAARALAELPVEFVAGDPAALAQRLGPRLALRTLLAAGLQLVGARLAPVLQATAALYVYENSRGARIALMVEPLDEVGAAPGAARRRPTASASSPGPARATGFVAAAREDATRARAGRRRRRRRRVVGRRRRSAPVARLHELEHARAVCTSPPWARGRAASGSRRRFEMRPALRLVDKAARNSAADNRAGERAAARVGEIGDRRLEHVS